VKFEIQDSVRADVLNVLPPMRAGAIAVQTGPRELNARWCNVNFLNFESTVAPHVHVIGDSIQIAALMPKSGHMASSQAKVVAAAVVAELNGWEIDPTPMLTNTCYSFIDDKRTVHVASVHEYVAAERTFKPVPVGRAVERAERARSELRVGLGAVDLGRYVGLIAPLNGQRHTGVGLSVSDLNFYLRTKNDGDDPAVSISGPGWGLVLVIHVDRDGVACNCPGVGVGCVGTVPWTVQFCVLPLPVPATVLVPRVLPHTAERPESELQLIADRVGTQRHRARIDLAAAVQAGNRARSRTACCSSTAPRSPRSCSSRRSAGPTCRTTTRWR
jgi:hypothetical protein